MSAASKAAAAAAAADSEAERQHGVAAAALRSYSNADAGLSSCYSLRFASSSSTSQDPKSRAAAAIDAIPGNSLVSKTGSIVLGTALTGAAIGTELFVVNEEIVVGVSFALLIGYLSTVIRAPYSEWAEGQIQKFKDILNQSRSAHTQAVQSRIDTVNEMKDVVGLTEQMFALSKVGSHALRRLLSASEALD